MTLEARRASDPKSFTFLAITLPLVASAWSSALTMLDPKATQLVPPVPQLAVTLVPAANAPVAFARVAYPNVVEYVPLATVAPPNAVATVPLARLALPKAVAVSPVADA